MQRKCRDRRSITRVLKGLPVVALAVTAGACGSSSSSESSGGGDAAQAPKAAGQCVQQARDAVNAARQPLELSVPEKAFDMPKGGTIWFISPTQATGYAQRVSKAVQAAATAAGMKAEIFDGKAQPDRFNQGIEQAIASKAAGIVTYAINPAVVPTALQKAKAAGIPVIAAATGVPNPTDGTVAETVSVDLNKEGQLMAQYAAATSDCKVNAAVTFDPNQKALTTQVAAVKSELSKLCPDTCSVQEHEMSLATMATQLGSSIQSLLQRQQKIDTVISTFDTAAFYMAPAIAQTGRKVNLIATNGLPENLDMVRQGKQAADVSYPPPEYTGWLLTDQLGRAIAGEPTENSELPMQLFDKSNIPASNDFEILWPGLADYQAAFKAKWTATQ
jgi:ribose transport system substrate-binding protein